MEVTFTKSRLVVAFLAAAAVVLAVGVVAGGGIGIGGVVGEAGWRRSAVLGCRVLARVGAAGVGGGGMVQWEIPRVAGASHWKVSVTVVSDWMNGLIDCALQLY